MIRTSELVFIAEIIISDNSKIKWFMIQTQTGGDRLINLHLR